MLGISLSPGSQWRGGGGAGFVGAYDAIPNIAAAFGMRRLLSDYTGALIRLRRSSDNAEQDIGYTSAGDLDTAAAADFIGGGSGFITTWYDQSGIGYHATQATAAAQPLYVASGQNGKPVGRWDGSNDGLITGSAISLTDLSALIAWDGDGSNGRILDARGLGASGTVAGWQLKNRNSSSDVFAIDDGAGNYRIKTNIAPSSAPHITTARFDSATTTASVFIDGGAAVGSDNNNGTMGAITSTKTLSIGKENGGSTTQIFTGDIMEIVIADAAWITANREAARDAMNAYWSIYA